MLARLKKTPVAAGIGFLIACAVCFLPALIAAIAAGGFVSAVGGYSGNAWVMAGGIFVLAGSIATGVWLMRRHRDECAPTLTTES